MELHPDLPRGWWGPSGAPISREPGSGVVQQGLQQEQQYGMSELWAAAKPAVPQHAPDFLFLNQHIIALGGYELFL